MATKGNTRASILPFGLDKSRIIWDPGGSMLLHRLGGKPNLKRRGMSGYGHGLMGRTTCASRPRPKEDTMKHYKNNRSRRGNEMEYSETKGYLPSREFPFIYCSSPSSRTLYFICCSLILYCSPHSSYRLLTEDQRIRYRRRAGREPSRRMRHVAVGRAMG